MNSIFRLESVRGYQAADHLYKIASRSILGHFSSLEKAKIAISKDNNTAFEAEHTYAYFIKEITVDGEPGEVNWLSVRSYDRQGLLIDECLQDYNLVNQFKGRSPGDIRFRIGDIVEVLDCDIIFTGIIAALPPTSEENLPVLDAMDDSYLVLPLDAGPIDHLHIPPTHTFFIKDKLAKECIDYLNTKLLIHQGRQNEADMRSICRIDGHRYLYNFATMPSKSICRRCHQKWLADYSGDLIKGDIWKEVEAFKNDPRTDEELVRAWGGR